jgi:Na+-translocating ferredoxin:NAD+ oxidoreductase RnfC subunit
MTPLEKAKELVEKFKNADFNCKGCDMVFCDVPCTMLNLSECKKCALICVDEIITLDYFSIEGREYWKQVKQELEKL